MNVDQKIDVQKAYHERTSFEMDRPAQAKARSAEDWSYSNPLYKYQEYLNPAPVGIDVDYALRFQGSKGSATVKYIDIESGWMLDHVSIKVNTLPCTGIIQDVGREHGTAALGIINMQENTGGGVGIAPDASGYVVSVWRPDGRFDIADAIQQASSSLDDGDILLLEIQGANHDESGKIWPVEFDDSVFRSIRSATQKGIIVIEPAGNGTGGFSYQAGNDLDECEDSKGNFPFNPHSPGFRDSGSIMVGAAGSSVPHKKMEFSNYGSRVDCFSWGEDVVTASRYPFDSGSAINTFTEKFCGTSGAAAIIAGAAILIQSIFETKHHSRLSPTQMRNILSDVKFGTNSENGRMLDKIGVMPDLKKILDCIMNAETSSLYA